MNYFSFVVWSKGVEGQPPCTRCTVTHPGGAEKCKSIDRMCKHCGLVGHLSKVHWVKQKSSYFFTNKNHLE